jgi:uncharacterized membrane protein YbhN (UPF0104 family)
VLRPELRGTGVHCHRRARHMVLLVALGAALEIGAAVGLGSVAGFHAVYQVLAGVRWPWLGVSLGAFAAGVLAYCVAYSSLCRLHSVCPLPPGKLLAVVLAGFGAFLPRGGAALDSVALRAAGAPRRDAAVQVTALLGLEQGVLALAGCGAAVAVLALGLARPPGAETVPWAVVPLPAGALAFWAAARYRGWARRQVRTRPRLDVVAEGIHVVQETFGRSALRHPAAVAMAGFWAAEIVALWSALAAFDVRLGTAALVVAFATGLLLTRRTAPLGGAGLLTVTLVVALHWSGAPLAATVAGVFVYRLLSLWVPLPITLASLPRVRRLGVALGLSP